jgi:hypothetical protein
MISKTHNCIFVHIPKNGGSSIENMIWPDIDKRSEDDLWMGIIKPFYNKYQTGGLQHLLAKQILQEVGQPFFDKSLKFTMVRNPWDKVISQYVYMKKRKDLRTFVGMPEECDFARYLELISRKKHVQWEHQHRFFQDDNGELLVNKIFRFENFNSDVAELMKELGIEFDSVIHTNQTKRVHYSKYYNTETKQMVADMYADDIKILNYSFEKPSFLNQLSRFRTIFDKN